MLIYLGKKILADVGEHLKRSSPGLPGGPPSSEVHVTAQAERGVH